MLHINPICHYYFVYINLTFACQEQNCCRLFVSRSIFNLVFSFSIVILDNAVHYRCRSIDNNKLTNRFDSFSQEIFPFVHSIIIHQISSPISLITFLWHVFILWVRHLIFFFIRYFSREFHLMSKPRTLFTFMYTSFSLLLQWK